MNHHNPKTAKIILGLNLGLYHHALNSCCPSKASPLFGGKMWGLMRQLMADEVLKFPFVFNIATGARLTQISLTQLN